MISRDYLSNDYIVRVEKSTCFKADQPHDWYLPHQPVSYPHNPGKAQWALNSTAKFHGYSFNDKLLTGADLLQNLIRFPKHPYAVSTDIDRIFSPGENHSGGETVFPFFMAGWPYNWSCTASVRSADFCTERFANLC